VLPAASVTVMRTIAGVPDRVRRSCCPDALDPLTLEVALSRTLPLLSSSSLVTLAKSPSTSETDQLVLARFQGPVVRVDTE
jgi:hypothetical protein